LIAAEHSDSKSDDSCQYHGDKDGNDQVNGPFACRLAARLNFQLFTGLWQDGLANICPGA